MKRFLLMICMASFALSAFAPAQVQQGARPRITSQQIQMADVTGDLGVPLGTCVKVQATIVRSDKSKGSDGRYYLKVTHVENRELRSPIQCVFDVHQFATDKVKLASGNFELHKLVTGKDARSLSDEQVAQLETGYVGKSVTLIAYETGGFRGMPDRLPKDVRVWQDFGFGFSTQVIVMDQL